MANKIDEAKLALEKVREENKDREATAVNNITAAVAQVFVAGAKVKTADKTRTSKDGKSSTVPGNTYKVDFVRGTTVLVLGKGGKVKPFEYTELTLVEESSPIRGGLIDAE